MRKQLSQPSFTNGFARSQGESVRPDLWDGLKYCIAPLLGIQNAQVIGERGPFDLTGKSVTTVRPHASFTTTDGICPSYTMSEYGPCLVSNTSGSFGGGISSNGTTAGQDEITVELLVNPSSSAAERMIIEEGSAYNTGPFYLLYAPAANPSFTFLIYTTNYSTATSTSSGAPAGNWYHVFGVWKSADGGAANIIVNGVYGTAGTARTGTLRATDTNIMLFGRPNSSNYVATLPLHAGGMIALCRIYNRRLTDNQILALTADQLLPLRRKKIWSMYVPSTGGVFKPAWARNKNILIGA